jgi:hypothetical protein
LRTIYLIEEIGNQGEKTGHFLDRDGLKYIDSNSPLVELMVFSSSKAANNYIHEKICWDGKMLFDRVRVKMRILKE